MTSCIPSVWRMWWCVLVLGTLTCVTTAAAAASENLVVESTQRSNSITCWTCPNKTSNGECNDWAPEIHCPSDESVCRTVHHFEGETGASVLVHKECVAPTQCERRHVGCWTSSDSSVMECVTCCTSSYCNEEVAVDNNTALQLSVSLLTGTASSLSTMSTLPLCLALTLLLGLSVT